MARRTWLLLAALAVLTAMPLSAALGQGEREACNCIFCQAKEKIKEATPWLKLMADARLREIYAPNIIANDHHVEDPDWHFQRYRFRLGWTVTPHQDIDLNWRLVWEPRNYCEPGSTDDPVLNEALFDRFNIQWRKPFGLPVTATVGRQDIIFGNGWLVLDGTPLDGSRTIFFDAARLTWDFQDLKTKVDTIYIDQHADTDRWLRPFNDKDYYNHESDERGAIVYATNKSLEKTQIDGYYIYKHDKRLREVWTSRAADIHALGARVVHDIDEHWQARGEFAQEFGWIDGENLCAFGFNGRVTYKFNDKCKNALYFGYEFLQGDDEDTGTVEKFDVLWARWPRWSEGYGVYGIILESGRPADLGNYHRLNLGWKTQPMEQLTLQADYHLLFTDENNLSGGGYSNSGCVRGNLLAAKLSYQFTPHISGHLLAEVFFPGDYYTDGRNDVSGFFRYELTFSW
jgi:hypothetical protein